MYHNTSPERYYLAQKHLLQRFCDIFKFKCATDVKKYMMLSLMFGRPWFALVASNGVSDGTIRSKKTDVDIKKWTQNCNWCMHNGATSPNSEKFDIFQALGGTVVCRVSYGSDRVGTECKRSLSMRLRPFTNRDKANPNELTKLTCGR